MMKKEKGFTIIELIIAIFVLSVAVIGVYNAFSTIVVLTGSASNRLVAAYLAQEGIEIIRNMRDQNWLDHPDESSFYWSEGLLECQIGCQLDYTLADTSAIIPWWGDDETGGDPLNIDGNGFYSYETGSQTKFRRKITVTTVPLPGEGEYFIKVSVKVFWNEKANVLAANTLSEIEVEETLYDWY